MKTTFLLLTCIVFSTFANQVTSQVARVNIAVKNAKIAQVLDAIENQTDYLFVYNANEVNLNFDVTVNASNESVAEVLSNICPSNGIVYAMEGNNIMLMAQSQQTAKTISGTIVDSEGLPIPGAAVVIKGAAIGTISDLDGKFNLSNVPDDATIQISFIGMNTVELLVKGKTLFDVVLKSETLDINEVVVVGYGVQKKINVTGAVASVNGEDLATRPVVNVTQSLQGMVPGLTASVGGSGGSPGQGLSLNIRGQGNLSGSDSPYVLVDGVEMNLADVNPNDIETISVLKDAAAASIYGARAAYGVILITTKKGSSEKMKLSYQGSAGWSSAATLPEMVNGYEFAKFFNQGNINAGQTPQYSAEQLELLSQYVKDPTGINCWPVINGNNSMSTLYENNSRGIGSTDWFKFHYKDYAAKQNHNLSVSGGNKLAQYYVSGGYYDEAGLLDHADINYRRYNFNANLTSHLTDWLKLNVNTKYSISQKDSPFGTGALNEGMFYHGLARFRATVSPYDLNGNYSELSQVPYLQSGTYAKTDNSNSVITAGFEVNPLQNWNVILDFTHKKGTTDYEAFATPATFIGIDGTSYTQNNRTELGIPDGGSFTRSMADNQYQSINLYTNYIFSINKSHNFTLLAGYQEEDNKYKYLYSNVQDIISTTNPGINLGTGDKNTSESRYSWATRGYFGRINYDYNGKYLVELNGRYDGSSRFAKENRWGWFPSVSVGWNLMHEGFMKEIAKTLNTFKLRASYGHLGNQSGAGLYTFAQTMGISTQGTWYFPDGRDMIIWGPGTFDSNVTWEKVESTNVGFDYGFLSNKITGSLDVFERKTKDMLGPSEDVADMFGASAPQTNNAAMRSRGWEFTINYRGKIANTVNFTIGGMLSDAQSEVTQYNNPTNTNPAGNWYNGRKAGEIWGYRSTGIIQTQEEADAYNQSTNTSYLTARAFTPGDLKFTDINNDGKINKGSNVLGDTGDMEVIGNTTPRYQYSINGSLEYKGLSLSLLLQGVGKRDYNPAGSNYFSGSAPYAQVTVFKEHMDYWSEENPNAYFPKPYVSGAGNYGSFAAKTIGNSTDYYIQDASYLRLKNLTISYNLPTSWLNKINLSKATVFLSGENLFTITNMIDLFDPELVYVSQDGGKNYPLNRVYSIGLTLNL